MKNTNPAQGRVKTHAYVYLIRSGRFLKIGISAAPEERLRHVTTNSPLSTELLYYFAGTEEDEASLHCRFRHLNVHGEWFKYDRTIREAFAERLIERGGHNGKGFVSVSAGWIPSEDSLSILETFR